VGEFIFVITTEDASQTELVDEQHYDIRVGAPFIGKES
jgi:hypothetical protein